jgi:UPF0716 family protein affecting phage T7 exclusion
MFLKDASSSKFTPFIQIFFFTTIFEFFILVPFVQAILKNSVFLSTCHNHEDVRTLAAFTESCKGIANNEDCKHYTPMQ